VFNHPFALEVAYIAVEEAIRLGASYADARFEFRQHEDVITRNGGLAQASMITERGVGVRALVRGAWGFSAVSEPTRHDVALASRRAVEFARAASILQEHPVRLVDQPPQRSIFRTQIKRDPLAVPLEDKVDLLLRIDGTIREVKGIVLALGSFSAHRQRKIYVNSEGSEIDQELVWTGVGYQAGASDGHDFQTRSFPGSFRGEFMGKGWELVTELPLIERAADVAREAVELVKADPCPNDNRSLLLTSAAAATQVFATCGQLLELDRVIGLESNSVRSFLGTDKLGNLELGSSKVNIYADAREAGGAGSFGFDDEGVEAQRIDLISGGRFAGYLSSRETAARVGLEKSHGTMRAAGWSSYPVIRMTNVSLAPGTGGDLEALIADTKSGVLMDTSRGFTVDADGHTFLASCEIGWEIEGGKRVRPLKNPTYQGTVPGFWRACDAVADEKSWMLHGVAHGSKAQPMQLVATGHGAPAVRFGKVELSGHRFVAPPIDAAQPVFVDGTSITDLPKRGTKRRGPKDKKKRRTRRRDVK
jgi:TldD protein